MYQHQKKVMKHHPLLNSSRLKIQNLPFGCFPSLLSTSQHLPSAVVFQTAGVQVGHLFTQHQYSPGQSMRGPDGLPSQRSARYRNLQRPHLMANTEPMCGFDKVGLTSSNMLRGAFREKKIRKIKKKHFAPKTGTRGGALICFLP